MLQQNARHDSFKDALEKDGRAIMHDPLTIRLEDVKFYVDLAAEKSLKMMAC